MKAGYTQKDLQEAINAAADQYIRSILANVKMTIPELSKPDGSNLASGCQHEYKTLQRNEDRNYFACEKCGATKIERIQTEQNSP